MMPSTARLACLWLCQVARALADACLFGLVLAQLAGQGGPADWTEPLFWLLLPQLLLAPVAAGLSVFLSQRRMVILATGFSFGAVGLYFVLDGPWLLCWILVAGALAIYLPAHAGLRTRFTDHHKRLNSTLAAITALTLAAGFAYAMLYEGAPLLILLANGVALLAAIPLIVADDVPRGSLKAVLDDTLVVFRDAELRFNLLTQSTFASLTFAVLFTWLLGNLSDQPTAIYWLLGGFTVGCVAAGLQTHVRRQLGLATLAGSCFTAILFFAAPSPAAYVALGTAAGVLHVALSSAFQAAVPRRALASALILRCAVIAAGCLVAYFVMLNASANLKVLLPLVIASGVTLLLWLIWHREVLEQLIEVAIRPLYRIRGQGEGLKHVPMTGPLLIVANHACWFDPIFLAKVLPRRLTPMMVSTFYDLPVMRWLMVHVVGAIRVQKSAFRREAPELRQAIEVLDRNGCVVIFPEGGLRRVEEVPLRRFGQGLWHILRERPSVPVMFCWIEGNWGSFFSYAGGAPTKNKRLDLGRDIAVGVSMPALIEPTLLEDQRRTRWHFMQECVNARTHLGRPSLPLPAYLTDDASDDADDAA